MTDTLLFPRDLLRLLYWVFFRPITLERYIKRFDPKLARETSMITLWRRGKEKPELRQLVLLSLFHILVTPWILGFAIAFIFSLLGFEVEWLGVAGGVAFGVAGGVAFGVAGGVAFGVAGGVAFGVAGGVAFGVAGGVAFGVAGGVAFGVAGGVAGGVAVGMAFELLFGAADGVPFGVAVGVAGSVAGGVAFGVAGGVAVGVAGGGALGVVGGVVFGVAFGAADGVPFGVAFGVSFILSYYRLYLYPLELPLSILLARRARRREAARLFHFSPVCWDETIFFRLYGLDQHLVAIGKESRQAIQEPLALVAQSFRQQWAARNALVELTAYDVEQARTLKEVAAIADKFEWLPPMMPRDVENVLPPLRETAQRAQAALNSGTLYNRQEQLRKALEETRRVRAGLGAGTSRQIAIQFGRALETWQTIFERELAESRQAEIIPNAYVSGNSLETGSKVFKGRRDLFQALEREFSSSAEQRPALLLFGARRTGKTSAIKQMPVRLGPDVIPVEINLQSVTVAQDVSGALEQVGEQIRNNASLYRRITLEPLALDALRADPYLYLLNWLGRVEQAVAPRWILLNLDEYATLTEMMEQGRVDERIFQFLRGVIQDHPRIALLLSGAHTLQDLPPIWSHYFINVRTLHLDALAESEARELIVNPIPDFPLQYETGAVEQIIAATGCQPYLVQATCRELVDALNHDKRMLATQNDVERALKAVLVTSSAYFTDLWGGRDSDDAQRVVMKQIAVHGNLRGAIQNIALEGLNKTLRLLAHRDILAQVNGEYRFRVELVRRWIVENAD